MKIHFITIFPESFESYFGSSIIKNAINKNIFEPVFHKLNDFSDKPQKRVDTKAYGTHGQVLSPEILGKAIEYIFEKSEKKIPVIYLSPRGELLHQKYLQEKSNVFGSEFIIICGHYEGIDERIIELYVDYHISIGEYVISSGELAAMVFTDAIVRLQEGVLGNSASREEDSFSEKLFWQKEYPVYTRPENYKGLSVPSVLLSGNHKKIEEWKQDNLNK
ncbi:MAG: tRNA (guanosine(37)-N1)-methyltransferase TrmD [Candidatus Gracilibacteria bacterium]|nr:tRNA (guanosine(37)-N1)-methyltransferase TrmD [Candidatus Gracilibacteria bacterium]